MLTKERFGATKYIGSISVRDDDDAVVRFDFASDAADQTDDSRPPRVSMAALGSDADANGAAFARSREVGTQHSGNHASCQADLDIPGLDGTEAFFAMPKEPPFRTVVHGVGYDASGAYAGAPRASLVGAFGAAAFPGTDDAAGYAAAVQQAAARSAAEQARSDQLLREAAARNSAVRNENADARAEAKEPTAGLESASAKAPPEQGPPPAAPGDAYGLSDHLPYSMPPYGLQPWAAYTPPQHAYAQIMYAQQQHSLFAQHGLYGYPMQPLMVGDGPSPPPRSPAAAQDQEPWPQRPTHSPATNVDSLTPRVLATQAIFRRQLDVIRQRLHAERFNADLAACGAGAMRFSSRQATSEYLDTHRPAPLPYWKAYMRVDPSLSENEARRLAVNHLQAQQAS
ncbi:hypothetical protein M885DRAFT_123734 [Pelagophyceae sp. CCMP2097]|nr:hypothetical protein M885DRAFT_123734 [Pelagophyceae sp. CCMP2097]